MNDKKLRQEYLDILKFYVLGYDFNSKKTVRRNIFDNVSVLNGTIDAIEKYREDHDFESFHKELVSLVKWKEWARVEYEISVGDPFPKTVDELAKVDWYYQFELNSYLIAKFIVTECEELWARP